MANKKWPAYVINLDKSTDRWNHMQAEFKDTVFELERFSAVSDPQGRGWVGVGKSYGEIVKKYKEKDPNFEKLLIVFEDDAFRTQDKETFNSRCNKIMEYLEQHKGEYSHFQGGGIYPKIDKIESTDPLLIRCDWITCATFTVIGKDAAETIMKYQDVPDDRKEPIDNYLAANNRGKMLVPFPHLCWQLLGIPSTISNTEQKVTLNEGFRNAHKTMLEFIKENNINTNIYSGGAQAKRKSKTLSFVDSVLRKQKVESKYLKFIQTNIFRKIKTLNNKNFSKKQKASLTKTHKSSLSSKVK
jgi:GR25 family glycosyltransferase involved in LPS biosynthesis